VKLHEHQRRIARSRARFKVIRGGRRGGKTKLETETLAFKAVSGKDRNVFYIAPTQIQARSIIWESLKARLAGIGEASEQRLEMRVPTQDGGHSTIKVAGWENRENFRGQSAHHITFDETDTMKDFFIGWQEIFRPALIDTGGTADFIGTPKKENPNLRRLEKQAEQDMEWATFHFTSWDNPTLPREELVKAQAEMDKDTYKQEILAEYVDNLGSLFKYTALVDLFSNTITKGNEKYLIVDIADDGSDKTVFSFWQGLELYRIELFERLNTESIVNQIREYAAEERIPYSQIAVDAIGVGAGVASNSLLDGIVGYKSSHGAFRTDADPVRLPNVHYTKDAPLISEYKNLRSQCVFTLAQHVNDHKIAVKVDDVRVKEHIIEELSLYQDASQGDGKRMATMKEDIKALLGRSPDLSDTLIMRMYFVVREKLLPYSSEEKIKVFTELQNQFARNITRQDMNSTR
jgi:propanediol dehydratase small subunit